MKRIVSLLLTAVLAIGMTAMAFAANPKITTQIAELSGGYVGDASPGQKIFLPFNKEAFQDATENLTASDVRSSKIEVRHTIKAGPKAIDSVEIKTNESGTAGVLVTLVDPFASTKPLDFEVSVYLYINGKRQSTGTIVEGTLTNDQQYVDSSTDYLDLSDGSVAICEENATKVETYLGEDVTVFVRMIKGKSYAGTATANPGEEDFSVLEDYPDIINVYTLTLDGLAGTGNIVRIDAGENYYVYDGELNYIGRTDDLLPLTGKYYVAEKRLDVIAQSEDEWDDEFEGEFEDEPEVSDETGEEAGSGSNPADVANNGMPAVASTSSRGDNPDTGVPPMVGVSAVAGLLALVAMAAVAPKKKVK